jgi:hypothetical protein
MSELEEECYGNRRTSLRSIVIRTEGLAGKDRNGNIKTCLGNMITGTEGLAEGG